MKYLKFILKAAVSAFLIYFVIRQIPLQELYRVMARSSYVALVVALFALFLNEFICVLRLRFILLSEAENLPKQFLGLKKISDIYFIGSFFGDFALTAVGGDTVKFFLFKREHVGSRIRLATVFLVDRVIALGSLILLFFLAFGVNIFLGYPLPLIPLNFSFNTGLLFGFIAILLVVVSLFYAKDKIKIIVSLFTSHLLRVREFSLAFLYSLVYQFFIVVIIFAMYNSLHPETSIPFFYFVLLVPIIIVVTTLPISLNGIGTRELLFVYLFGAIGGVKADLLALSLLFLVFSYVQGLYGGILFLLSKKKNADSAIFSDTSVSNK